MSMTLATFMAEHPEAAAALRAEALAEAQKDAQAEASAVRAEAAQQAAEAATAEQGRVLALASALLDEKSVETLRSLALSGVTPEQAESMRAIFSQTAHGQAQADHKRDMLDALRGAHAHTVNPLGATDEGPQDFQTLVTTYQEKHGSTHGAAITAVATEHPEAHSQWLKKQQGARS